MEAARSATASSRGPEQARPPMNSAQRSPERRAAAAASSTLGVGGRAGGGAGADAVGRVHGHTAVGPRDVGRQDERRHRPRAGRRRRPGRRGRRRPTPGGGLGGADERRHVAGHGGDVRLELGVVGPVGEGVVAHDVDHGTVGPAGVVQVGQAVAEARARGGAGWRPAARRCGRSRRRRRWPPPRTGRAPRACPVHVVEGGDEVHLRGAGIHEAGVDPVVDEGADEGLGSVHGRAPSGRGDGPRTFPGLRMPCGVEGVLDPAHQVELDRILEVGERRPAWPCRCRARPRRRRRGPRRRPGCRGRAGGGPPGRAGTPRGARCRRRRVRSRPRGTRWRRPDRPRRPGRRGSRPGARRRR